jgi:mannose-6-phosphate isomerase-like protein (cupin superfamily)
MEIVRKDSTTSLSNSGVQSEQLLFPENSSSRRVTLTRVTVLPGATNPPHRQPASEQIWVALEGSGILLLDDERQERITAGDAVRFADGDRHGFHNPGDVPFVYLSVTAPPVNFREAYSRAWTKTGACENGHEEPAIALTEPVLRPGAPIRPNTDDSLEALALVTKIIMAFRLL